MSTPALQTAEKIRQIGRRYPQDLIPLIDQAEEMAAQAADVFTRGVSFTSAFEPSTKAPSARKVPAVHPPPPRLTAPAFPNPYRVSPCSDRKAKGVNGRYRHVRCHRRVVGVVLADDLDIISAQGN